MAPSSESFKDDRAWHTTDLPDPDDCVTLRQQHEYQRLLRKRWDAMGGLPSEILSFPMPDERWFTHPHGIDPSYQQRQQLRKLRNAR